MCIPRKLWSKILKVLCKNQFCIQLCKVRPVKNKSNVLVLLWMYTAFLSLLTLGYERALIFNDYEFLVLMFVPIGGWLGDVYFGRYKVIKYSMRLLWVTLIACDLILAVEKLHQVLITVLRVTAGIGAVAAVGILANSFQFGMDQLIDASSSEIACFIRWMIWTFFLSESVFLLSTTCFCGLYNSDAIAIFQLPLICTVSIICDCFLNHWLIKEPVKHNPVKLIYQVLKYAAKNRHPRLRSAFTYWEDKPYSRIDLGKNKYGGPFTTEQVEDVKTFFRILAMVVISTPLMCLMIGLYFTLVNTLYLQFEGEKSCQTSISVMEYMTNCFDIAAVNFSSIYLAVLILPVLEFIIYPLMKKCSYFHNVSIFHRFLFSIIMLMIYLLSILCIEITATHITQDHNVTCLLNIHGNLPKDELLNLNVNWLILPQLFLGTSSLFMVASMAEFIIAQAPYSMRGFLLGNFFFFFGVSIIISNVCLKLITKLTKKYAMAPSVAASCGAWYFGLLLLLSALMLCGGVLVKKWYTPRRRDEDLHNQQKFAIDYFEKYIPYNQ